MSGILTPKQKNLLDFIGRFQEKKGFSPSQSEIAAHFKFKSLGTVQNYLVRLERNGHLKKSWNSKRAIQLHNHEAAHDFGLPLLGRVAAGRPIEVIQSHERIEVPKNMIRFGEDYFVLEVDGDSMIDEGILDKDYVIVKKQDDAGTGEIVVGLIENAATIKYFYKKKDCIELHSANPKYKPIIVRPDQDFRIQGVFAGLLRKRR